MSDDIVARLRNATRPYMELGWPLPYKVQRSEPLWLEAADEIDRLRERLESLRKERLLLCSKPDDLIDRLGDGIGRLLIQRDEAIRERNEARREIWENHSRTILGPREFAAARGWDCFKEEENGKE